LDERLIVILRIRVAVLYCHAPLFIVIVDSLVVALVIKGQVVVTDPTLTIEQVTKEGRLTAMLLWVPSRYADKIQDAAWKQIRARICSWQCIFNE
jgi:hypothetical protein